MKYNVYPAKGGTYCLLVAAVLSGLTASALAVSNIYVAMDGDDTRNGADDWTNAVATISNGIAHASTAGDTVWVSNGTYGISTQIYISQNIILRSANGRDYTVVDGGGTNRCLAMDNSSLLVSGFTLSNGLAVGTGKEGQGEANEGGGLSLWQGTFSNGIVRQCVAKKGGGVYIRSSAKVKNCIIIQNVTTGTVDHNGGAGVMLAYGGSLYDSHVGGNTSALSGGGVFVDGSGFISNCVISSNQASDRGGGISVRYLSAGSTFSIYDSIISNNTVLLSTFAGGGGGIMANHARNFSIISGCDIVNNRAVTGPGGGFALYCWDSPANLVLLTNCLIANNRASTGGGGIYQAYASDGAQTGPITAKYCRIIGNISDGASSQGGGIRVGTNCTLDYCVISNNVATNNSSGGGIYVKEYALLQMQNCLVANNTAYSSAGGGAIYLTANATGTVSSCTIAGNTATNLGGGIYFAGAGGVLVSNSVIYGNTNRTTTPAGNDIYDVGSCSNSFYYSCSPGLRNSAQGNITNDPLLVNSPANCRLGRGSPGINVGFNQDWMTNAVDLDGRARIRYGTVDMGAYEAIYDAFIFTAH